MTYFFKNLYCQNHCKEGVNIGGGQIKGALFNFFLMKKCPFCILREILIWSYFCEKGPKWPKEKIDVFIYQKTKITSANMFL